MIADIEKLRPGIERRVELHKQGVVTELEATAFIFGECVLTLLNHPHSKPHVDVALGIVPSKLMSKVATLLANKQSPDGTWEWPPVGGIGPPITLTQFGKANAAETAALETFASCVRSRVGREPSENA